MATEKKKSSSTRQSTSGGMPSKTKSKSPDRSDLFALLKKDHEKVKGLFEQLQEDGEMEMDSREELFSQIQEEIEIHMEGEEKFFYPALDQADETHEKVLESYEEHHVAKTVLEEFEELDQEDERWMAKVKVLKEIVEHHVEEEEKELFKLAKKTLDKEEIQEISMQIQERKAEMQQA
jgi:hypothetical protein